jgi:hypothetical protein
MIPVAEYDEDMKVIINTDAYGNKHLRMKDVELPDIRFIYSPYLLKLPVKSYQRFSESIMKLCSDSIKVEVIEDKYQAKNDFPGNADIILKFASYQTLLDFIYKKNEAFFEELKFIINDIAAARNDNPDLIMLAGLHLSFEVEDKGQNINATFAILNKDLEINNKISQRIEQGMQYIAELRTHIKINQVLLAATNSWPYWKFLAFNNSDTNGYDSNGGKYQKYIQV